MKTTEKYGYIYKITLPESSVYAGCFYIGKRKSPIFLNCYYGSGTRLLNWYKHNDKHTVIREILAWAYSQEELEQLEIEFIKPHLKDPKCWNLHTGGVHTDCFKGRTHTIETREKMRKAKLNRPISSFSEETLRRISENTKIAMSNLPHAGRTLCPTCGKYTHNQYSVCTRRR